MNLNYEYNSFIQNVYIVCERSPIDLPQFNGSNKLGTPIKAFDNIHDAEHFVNEMSIGLRYINTIPFQKSNFQNQVPNIIYNILPPIQPSIQPSIQPPIQPSIQPPIQPTIQQPIQPTIQQPYTYYNASAPTQRPSYIYNDNMNIPRY